MDKKANISNIVKGLLDRLTPRQKAVIQGRFGLNLKECATLASLGSGYGITRERVRQIEALALDAIHGTDLTDLNSFSELVQNYLANVGGAKREDLLLADLQNLVHAPQSGFLNNQLRFLLEASGRFKYFKDKSDLYAFWYVDERAKQAVMNFTKNLLSALKSKKEELVKNQSKFGNLFADIAKSNGLTETVAMNYAGISKKFVANEYGEFGLSHWPEVNPRTARDWAHMVLRREKKPLHFTEIAKAINATRKDRKIHHQTVHNELIKDEKFVLVGKGIYGLRELGLIPGTAREVIGYLLDKHGPMKSKVVVDLVLKERFLKVNTILINLQNKKYFERLGDGRYTIKEA